MTSEPDIHEREWDAETPDPAFRTKAARVGAHAGAHGLGATPRPG